jgi:hypothetical protein
MYGLTEMKTHIEITEDTVSCPVKGCINRVLKQKKVFKRDEEFFCKAHKIYISPATFEYADYKDNLLWVDFDDTQLLKRIFKSKRESRMARERSEDAVTWNVFRFLEKNGLAEEFVSGLSGKKERSAELIYWSYSQKADYDWEPLNDARVTFGEAITRGSEPDLIIKTEDSLVFLEAKLGSGNKTKPSETSGLKAYRSGGNNWFQRVFSSDYQTIAVKDKKYELMRFWLLGTWLAQKLGLRFYLVNLVRAGEEKEIEGSFGKHIKPSQHERFMRKEWEEIYHWVISLHHITTLKDIMRYFENKTFGYGPQRDLQRAFRIS